MSQHTSVSWRFPPPDVADILLRHSDRMTQDLDVQLVLPHLIQRNLLTEDQLYKLGDSGYFALTRLAKATQLLQFIVPHGVRGLKALVSALLESGEHAPHPGHTYWGQTLEAELNGKL